MKRGLLLILFLGLIGAKANAAISPVSIGLLPPLQFPPSDFNITGARVSLLWGEHRSVSGIDIGVLGNISEVSFNGIGIAGIFNMTHGETTIVGLQLAGFANI